MSISHDDLFQWVCEYIDEVDDWVTLIDVFRYFGYDPDRPTEAQITEVIGKILGSGNMRVLLVNPNISKVFETGEEDALVKELEELDPLYFMMAYLVDKADHS
ncbi:hypothetical protein [Corynebacterium lowii]|uniref:Uncharacterized protein n=1 Tax=Corynebacterium lowii TaxID=1544413 RepID=A0A0Q0ZA46_9CORY|nr:hypothetical protein [Corynebacterium lowii]KQB86661.1 hypothetical protein Clow_00869 [Corynebacterium lowii]MDP9851346.1 hypothetical protein [Corynebacterium lowii]